VWNSLLQSIERPKRWKSLFHSLQKKRTQCSGSANFGISLSGIPIDFSIPICFGSPSLTRRAAATMGLPVACQPWGNSTLNPFIRLYRAMMSFLKTVNALPRWG
jgi:hypothetical protein